MGTLIFLLIHLVAFIAMPFALAVTVPLHLIYSALRRR